jgi:hypothetical protein
MSQTLQESQFGEKDSIFFRKVKIFTIRVTVTVYIIYARGY